MRHSSDSAVLMPEAETGDRALLERYIEDGDEAAFASLVQRHGRLVWGVCRRFLRTQQDAEDAYQAVFLILARKASSIRNADAVGAWLYGVACRLALRAKQSAARRQEIEQKPRPSKADSSPPGEAACRELQRVLDEELMRLKEKYRQPFVLCCLEGMTKSEAAKELALKEGTVSGRLARARKILQSRLARRGFKLGVVLAAVALAQGAAWAAVPAVLAEGTAGAVLTQEAGQVVALPESVVTLADNYLQSSRLASLGAILAVLAAFLFFTVGAGMTTAYFWARTPTHADVPLVNVVDPITFLPPGKALGTPIGEQVLTVAFSPNGKRLVTAGAWGDIPGQLKIWDTASTQELKVKSRIPGVRSAAYAPDGSAIATGDFSGALTLRDPESTEEIASVRAHESGVNSVAFSRDGERIATAGLDRLVKIWSTRGLREEKVLRGHTDRVLSVAFSRNGQWIVTGSQDRTIKIWDLDAAKVKFTLEGHTAGVEGVAISPDDKVIATVSPDKQAILWDAENGAQLAILDAVKEQPYLSVAFSHDGAVLAAGGRESLIHLWDVKTRQSLGMIDEHKGPVWALAFSTNDVLASGSADKTAKLWRMKGKGTHKSLSTSWSEVRPVRAAAYSPDGNALAVATNDNAVHIRDTKVGDILRVLHGHHAQVNQLAFSPAAKILASASDDRTIKLWDWTTGDELHTLAGHTGPVHALTFTRDGKWLLSAGADMTIRFWNPANGEAAGELNGHTKAIRALAVSQDHQWLASGSGDDIKIWDIANKLEVRSFAAHKSVVTALAYSPTGSLASAGDDRLVKIWDTSTGNVLRAMRGHTDDVLALAFSPKGGALVSAGKDRSVRVWDPASGDLRGVLNGHKNAITALAMHPHGRDLVSGSMDTLLLRWQAATDNVRAAENAPPRKATADEELFTLFLQKVQDTPQKEGNPKTYAKEYYRSFQGKPDDRKGFELTGPEADKCVKFDADGLRITLPTAFIGERPKTGVVSRMPFAGDFEITVGVEVLQEPERENTGKDATRMSLSVDLQGSTGGAVNFSRRMGMPNGAILVSWSSHREEGDDKNQVKVDLHPSVMKPRRLRLVRQGAELSFLVSESVDGDFVLLAKRPFSNADVRDVRITGCTAGPNASLDFRVHDLRIRAASFPAPTSPVATPRPSPERVNIALRNGIEAHPNLRFTGGGAAALAKSDEQGLRFTLLPTRDGGHDVGLDLATRLRGDFEVTLGYEILSLPEPAPENGAGAVLQVHFDTLDSARARLSRMKKAAGSTLGSNYVTSAPDGKEIFKGLNFPKANEKVLTGKLRLVRAGTKLHYQVNEGDTTYRTIATYTQPTVVDVVSVRALASTGWRPVPFDVRFTHLEMRSESGVRATLPPTPQPVAPDPEAAQADASPRGWLAAIVILGGVIVLLATAAGALLIAWRIRARAQETTPLATRTVPKSPVIFFACSACDSQLKVKASAAGKIVKCRQCGNGIRVPQQGAKSSGMAAK